MDKNLVIIIVAFVFLLIVVFMYMSARAKTEQAKLAVMQDAIKAKSLEQQDKTTFADVALFTQGLGGIVASIV